MQVFWHVKMCCYVNGSRRFGKSKAFIFSVKAVKRLLALKIKALRSSETSGTTRPKKCNIPENWILRKPLWETQISQFNIPLDGTVLFITFHEVTWVSITFHKQLHEFLSLSINSYTRFYNFPWTVTRVSITFHEQLHAFLSLSMNSGRVSITFHEQLHAFLSLSMNSYTRFYHFPWTVTRVSITFHEQLHAFLSHFMNSFTRFYHFPWTVHAFLTYLEQKSQSIATEIFSQMLYDIWNTHFVSDTFFRNRYRFQDNQTKGQLHAGPQFDAEYSKIDNVLPNIHGDYQSLLLLITMKRILLLPEFTGLRGTYMIKI
jgi:hypothetical protein